MSEEVKEKIKFNAEMVKDLGRRMEVLWVKMEKISNQIVKTFKEITEK